MSGKTTTKAAKPAVRTFRIATDQLPVRVDMPDGTKLEYRKRGAKFVETDWPMPHRTIPAAIKAGLIEEVN